MIQACVESSLGYSSGRGLGRSGQIRGMEMCGAGLALRMKSREESESLLVLQLRNCTYSAGRDWKTREFTQHFSNGA